MLTDAKAAETRRRATTLWRLGCASLVLAVLVLAATGTAVYQSWNQARKDTRVAELNRTYLGDLNDILGDLKDAETGQRGFVLTGREHYLDPYTQAVPLIEADLKDLSKIAAAQSDQKQAIEFIQQRTRAKMAELAETLELRRKKGFDAALAEVLTDRGRAAMDDVRREVQRVSEVQAAAAVARSRESQRLQRQAVGIGAFGGAVLLLLMIAGFVTLTSGANHETKLAERLTDSREVFETTLTSIGDGVISTNTAGIVMFINPQAVALTGWSKGEAIGKPLDEIFRIVNETTRQKVESPFEKVMKTGAISGLANHTILIRKDGSEVPIDDSGAPIRNVKGLIGGVVLVFRDITERRKAEASLAESHAEVLKANEELRQFSYAATHDLQEPLRTIVVFSQLLARGYTEVLDTRGRHMLQTVEDAAHRMSSLIDDLLSYTRAGGMESSAGLRTAVNASEILNDTLIHLHGAIEESRATVTQGELPLVFSDAAQLSQVFQNLISNAIKYRKPDVDPVIQVSCTVDGDRATFCVKDNGMGFKQEYAERIFLLFQRLHGRSIPGTGIGLALCRRIVERHGGRIWATSEEGVGSSFFFTTPLAHAQRNN